MSELKLHVDSLFSKYPMNDQMKDLKEEILGNLESKKADLMAEGLDEYSAIAKAKQSLTSIDYLIDGNRKIYIHSFSLELLQWILISLLISWIITIPLQLDLPGTFTNTLLFIMAVLVGILYLIFSNRKNKADTKFINIVSFAKWKKYIWLFWLLFITIVILYSVAINFGSNIWFLRPIHIDGPYQFAILAIRFLLPLLTIQIPLIVNKAFRLLEKYEVSEADEN